MASEWALERVKYDGKHILTAGKWVIGRSPRANINCTSLFVSRTHCIIEFIENIIKIIDNNSSNGTFVNCMRLPMNQYRILKADDVIGIGVDGTNIVDKDFFVFKLKFKPPIDLEQPADQNELDIAPKCEKRRHSIQDNEVSSDSKRIKIEKDASLNYTQSDNDVVIISDDESMVQAFEKSFKSRLENSGVSEGHSSSASFMDPVVVSESDDDDIVCIESDNEDLDGWINKLSQNYSVKQEISRVKNEEDDSEFHMEIGDGALLPLSQNLRQMIMEDESNLINEEIMTKDNKTSDDLGDYDFIGMSEEASTSASTSISVPISTSVPASTTEPTPTIGAISVKPCSVKVPKLSFVKPPIIDAPAFLSKRRSSEARSHPLKEPPKPKEKIEKPKVDDKHKYHETHKKRKGRTRSSDKISKIEKDEKEKICQIRKNRLKEIAEKAAVQKEKHDSSSHKTITSKPKVKFTENNRGAFLTDDVKTPDKKEERRSSTKESKSSASDLPKISSLPKIPKKKSSTDEKRTSTKCTNEGVSLSNISNPRVSDNFNQNTNCKTASHDNKKISIDHKRSSIDRKSTESKPINKENKLNSSVTKDSTPSRKSSVDMKCNSVDKNLKTGAKVNNENSSSTMNSSILKHDGSISKHDSSVSKHNVTHDTKNMSDSMCLKSCLKTPGEKPRKRRSVRITIKPKIQYFEIEEGNRLNRTNVKDLPFNWQEQKKKVTPPIICSKEVLVKKVENIDRIIVLITSWNPAWLDEQKDIAQPPPLLLDTTYKLTHMLHSYSNYTDYEKTVFPLMIMELWASIFREWITRYQFADQRKKTYSIAIDQILPRPGQAAPHNSIMVIHSHMLLNRHDHDAGIHPREGDLILIGFVQTTTDANSNNSPARSKANVRKRFALVTNIRKQIARDQVVHQGLLTYVTEPYAILFLELKTFYKTFDLDIKKIMGACIISYLNPVIRNIKAVFSLPNSPLCSNVLNPNEKQFIKHQKDGKRCIDNTPSSMILNPAQERAVMDTVADCMLPQPMLTLIQGPPGTGKSKVIVSIIKQLLYGENLRPTNRPKILICAPSNAAIDELVCRLLTVRQTMTADKFKMVRFGVLESMNPKVQDISLQNLVDRDTVRQIADMKYADMDSMETEKRFLEAKQNSLKLSIENATKNKQNTYVLQDKLAKCERKLKLMESGSSQVPHGQLMQMKRESQRLILSGADIVCTTLSSCVNGQMSSSNVYFNICIVDEATQCTEPDTLMPLMLGISKLILVGDPQQLPATVLSQESKNYGFQRSLFARIESCLEHITENPIKKLIIQYRMHPEICHWPNSYFYQGSLENAYNNKDVNTLLPYAVFSLSYTQSPNFSNAKEADFVINLATTIVKLTPGLNYTIGIITPYQSQRICIVNKLKRWSNCFQNRFCDANTIDSIQGQERDVIIVSLARTDGVGFLADFERLNVALTRAKHSLFVCGNFSSLKKTRMWEAFMKDAQDRNVFKDAQNILPQNYDKILNLVAKQP